MKRPDMDVAVKTVLAKKNIEMEKLEKSKKSHLRMITSSSAKLKMKYGSPEEISHFLDPDAKNIRMYETHMPGFCYLRNGEYRKRASSAVYSSTPDPIQCSEKIKAMLFTDNELDIFKTVCLHLLGTHVQSKNHIQRKDGRLCSYVKAQATGYVPLTLQPFCQRVGSSFSKISKYDKMLPRYVLDVKSLRHGVSKNSFKNSESNSGSDDEVKKKRKLQVPIYINNEIRMIIHSVLEALEEVNSSKLNSIVELASSPEELRNLLKSDNFQEYITELSTRPLVMRPTSYDFVMTHLMFDKIPEEGTLESVAQVLEIYDSPDLYGSLNFIRKAIFHRHTQLANINIIPRSKAGIDEKSFPESFKTSNTFTTINAKCLENFSNVSVKKNAKETIKNAHTNLLDSFSMLNRTPVKSVSINSEKTVTDDQEHFKDSLEYKEYSLYDENKGSFLQSRASIDSNKYSFQNLSNSQRILFGLKVAGLKSKSLNVHQFEGKKKMDLAAVIAPIICSSEPDADMKQVSHDGHISAFSLHQRMVKKSSSDNSASHTNDLENLTRSLLANLRLDISDTENKKRVTQFMATLT